MARVATHTLRVRYAECDAQGRVFNAHFFAYFDLAMTELFREALGGYHRMIDAGVDLVVAEAGARFLGPASFDDELELRVRVTHLGTTSLLTDHEVVLAAPGPAAGTLEPGDRIVAGQMRHVCVDATSYAKAPIPDDIRGALAPYLVDAEDLEAAR